MEEGGIWGCEGSVEFGLVNCGGEVVVKDDGIGFGIKLGMGVFWFLLLGGRIWKFGYFCDGGGLRFLEGGVVSWMWDWCGWVEGSLVLEWDLRVGGKMGLWLVCNWRGVLLFGVG